MKRKSGASATKCGVLSTKVAGIGMDLCSDAHCRFYPEDTKWA